MPVLARTGPRLPTASAPPRLATLASPPTRSHKSLRTWQPGLAGRLRLGIVATGYEPATRKGVECRLGGSESILKIAFQKIYIYRNRGLPTASASWPIMMPVASASVRAPAHECGRPVRS